MRRLIALAVLTAAAAAAPARADPYLPVSASRVEGLTMLDVASVRKVGPYTRAWAYLVLPDRKPQRVYLEASEVEFDCGRKRTRLTAGVRYDERQAPLARTDKVGSWEPLKPRSPIAEMHRQVCASAFDPERLRGHGKTVDQYANEMRPFLAKLEH
jgi:hypothetical protein